MTLYRICSQETQVDGKILGFSVSHNHQQVHISGHYASIQSSVTTYHRHMIRAFNFRDLDGKERWTAYSFVKNVYDHWVPGHFQAIRRILALLPSHPAEIFAALQHFTSSETSVPDAQWLSKTEIENIPKADDNYASGDTSPSRKRQRLDLDYVHR